MRSVPGTVALIGILACCVSPGLAQNAAGSRQQATHQEMAQVSAEALSGMVESKTLPEYPKDALLKGIQGDVIFKIVVDETGKIVRREPTGGDPLLVAASKDALQGYRLRPYLVNGTPVPFESQLGYRFTLTHTGDGTQGKVECMFTIP